MRDLGDIKKLSDDVVNDRPLDAVLHVVKGHS